MIDFPASPTTGQIFTSAGASWRWDGTKWVAYGGGSSGDVGRNQLHNSTFEVRQRGPGNFTTNGAYTADRWQMQFANDTASFSMQQSVIGAIGDDAIYWVLNGTFTGNVAATAFTQIGQKIENLLRLSGKTVTVSFYAYASATLKLGCNIYQYFGTGGSPSAGAWVQATGNAATITTSWQRFSFTYVIPSAAGKTLGTNNDHFTHLLFGYSAGANANAQYGNIGVQSGTIYISGVQLEIGSSATPLEKLEYADDLRHCQRHYQTLSFMAQGYSPAANNLYNNTPLPVPMRAAPSVTTSGVSTSNCTFLTPSTGYGHVQYAIQITATGYGYATGTAQFSADL